MANDYDKILRENFNELILHLLKTTLNLDLPQVEVLKDKIQVTMESEVDNVMKVIHKNPRKNYLLHVEVQSSDQDMRGRNLWYYGYLYERYRLPVEQVVIYLGLAPARKILKNELKIRGLRLVFPVIDVATIKKDVFLQAETPESVVLAILSDFDGEDPEQVILKILERLLELVGRVPRLEKYQRQLQVLSRLRKLTAVTKKNIELMPIHYDIQTDELYLEGIEKGIEKGIEQGKVVGIEAKTIETVFEMHKDGMSNALIAKYLKITENKVQDIIKQHLNRSN